MRKAIIFFGALIFSSLSQVQAGSDQLFDCVDSTTLEIDGKCVESKIENNGKFLKFQESFFEQQSINSGNVVSTLIFDERKMQIDVIAHSDAVNPEDLFVANDID